MSRLRVDKPGIGTVKDWQEEYLEDLRKGNWLGSPDYSVELHILDGTRKAESRSVSALRDKISEPNLYAFFADTPKGIVEEKGRDFHSRVNQLNQDFQGDVMDIDVYLDSLYSMIPESDFTRQSFAEAELTGLDRSLSLAEELEEAMNRTEDYIFEGASLITETSADNIEEAYRQFQEGLALELDFEYSGDKKATQEFHEMVRSEEEYDGVPGQMYVDGTRIRAEVPSANKVGLDVGEIDELIRDELE